jgi:hypothetical protein
MNLERCATPGISGFTSIKKIGEFRKMISKALIKSSFNHTVFHERNS